MPSRADITYFGAGPALLGTDVLENAAAALVNYKDTGLGIAEHSHRSELAANVINEAKADLAEFLDIPTADYEVLFMQGGGTGEFSASVYNLVGAWVARQHAAIVKELGEGAEESAVAAALKQKVESDLKLDYIVTGGWSLKAYQEAVRLLGQEYVNLAADARDENGKFGRIPDQSTWKLSNDAALVYHCANETVDGVEFQEFPQILAPKADGSGPIVVADMSSNILSRRIPVSNYSLIFFGAQKNLGSTGITVAILKKSFLPPTTPQPKPVLMRKLGLPIPPIIFQYEIIAKNNSLYNTLSIFDVYIAGQVLKKLLGSFPNKVDGQEELAKEKADLIYGALDAHPEAYKIVPEKSVRSRMNICFRVIKKSENASIDETEKTFLKEATAIGLTGLKGHRSVGGIRASNYNAIPLEGAQKLAKFLESFATA